MERERSRVKENAEVISNREAPLDKEGYIDINSDHTRVGVTDIEKCEP